MQKNLIYGLFKPVMVKLFLYATAFFLAEAPNKQKY